MIDKTAKKKNIIKKSIQLCLVMVAVVCGELVSRWWLDDSLLWHCIITGIIIFLFSPLNSWIDNKIDRNSR